MSTVDLKKLIELLEAIKVKEYENYLIYKQSNLTASNTYLYSSNYFRALADNLNDSSFEDVCKFYMEKE